MPAFGENKLRTVVVKSGLNIKSSKTTLIIQNDEKDL